jgi:hypothetical protein
MHRPAHVGIGDAVLCAEPPQREEAIWIMEIRGEPFRLEEHALGHVSLPKLHRAADDAVLHPGRAQMRRNRQSVGAGADDRDVRVSSHHHSSHCSAP